MKKLILIACIIVAGMITTEAKAQMKAAVVSIEEVIQLMPEYKKASQELAQFDSALQINYAETLKELQRQDSVIKADSAKWSSAQKTAKQQAFTKLLTEFQNFEQVYQQQKQQKEEELFTPVFQKATQLIKDIAKSNGYSHVFRKEAMFDFPEADDLLPKIKTKLITPAAPAKK